MIEVELQTPDGIETEAVVRVVEQVCASYGLTCTVKGTLLRYPGSIHWHFKQDKRKGTLEITWLEREHLLWFKVAGNRTSEWIHESIYFLKQQIEKALLLSLH